MKTTKLFRNRKRSYHKLWKKKWVFLRRQRRGQITLKNCSMPYLQSSINQRNQRGLFQPRGYGICHKTQKQTEWWKFALVVMRRYCKHNWITVPNLINNSLINCAGTNSRNITMILSFIAQNRIHFKTRKKNGFSQVSFVSYPNPGFLNFAPNWKH